METSQQIRNIEMLIEYYQGCIDRYAHTDPAKAAHYQTKLEEQQEVLSCIGPSLS